MSTTGGSAQGTVLVLDEPDVIRKKFKTAVTDSGREIRYAPDEKPGVSNLIEILSVATGRPIPEVERGLRRQGLRRPEGRRRRGGRRALPRRSRRATTELRADEGELRRLLQVGAEKARADLGADARADVRADGVRPTVSPSSSYDRRVSHSAEGVGQ